MTKGYDQRKEANKKYLQKLDEIKVRMPKGGREKIRAHAEVYDNGSVNAFVNRAISEQMERDKGE